MFSALWKDSSSPVPAGEAKFVLVKEMPEYMVCVVCCYPMEDPRVICQNGHVICSTCLSDYQNRKYTLCTHCRTELLKQTYPIAPWRNAIECMEVQCMYHLGELYCPWKGALCDYERHKRIHSESKLALQTNSSDERTSFSSSSDRTHSTGFSSSHSAPSTSASSSDMSHSTSSSSSHSAPSTSAASKPLTARQRKAEQKERNRLEREQKYRERPETDPRYKEYRKHTLPQLKEHNPNKNQTALRSMIMGLWIQLTEEEKNVYKKKRVLQKE